MGWAILNLSMTIGPAALLGGLLAAVFLPIVSLFEGLSRGR